MPQQNQQKPDQTSWNLPSLESLERDYSADYPLEDTYIFKLVNISDPFENNYDASKERRIWEFEVADVPENDPDMVEKRVGIFYTMTSSPKGNLYPIVKALVGGTIDPTIPWGPDMVMGRMMKATLTFTEPNDQGKTYPKIEGAVPYRPRRAKAAPAAEVPEPETAEVPF